MDKHEELLKLAKIRQSKTYPGYTSIGDYNDGAYECDYVSPYSKSAHNVDSKVLLILKDWCSEKGFDEKICLETLKYGYTPSVSTNINLKKLLQEHLKMNLEQTYATNLFPYIKPGEMNSYISAKDMKTAAEEFAIPIIDIVKPKVTICFGLDTFNAVRKACGHSKVYNNQEAICSHFDHQGTSVFCQAHPSQQGQNKRNQGGLQRVSSDWKMMLPYL